MDEVKPIRCPHCGYCPVEEVEAEDYTPSVTEFHQTHELDWWDCVGAEEGNLICPQCATEFDPNTGKVWIMPDDWPKPSPEQMEMFP